MQDYNYQWHTISSGWSTETGPTIHNNFVISAKTQTGLYLNTKSTLWDLQDTLSSSCHEAKRRSWVFPPHEPQCASCRGRWWEMADVCVCHSVPSGIPWIILAAGERTGGTVRLHPSMSCLTSAWLGSFLLEMLEREAKIKKSESLREKWKTPF